MSDASDDTAQGFGNEQSHNFSVVYNDIVRKFGRLIGPYGAAIYLSICNYSGSKAASWPSHRRMAEDWDISITSVKKSLALLESAGLIRIEQRYRQDGGLSSNWYIVLDLPDVSNVIHGPQSPHAYAPSRHTPMPPVATRLAEEDTGIKKIHKNNTVSGKKLPDTGGGDSNWRKAGSDSPKVTLPGMGTTVVESSSAYSDTAAKRLLDAVVRVGQFDKANAKPARWAAIINKYIKAAEITTEEFDIELSWYCDHILELKVPEAFAAISFCEKFIAIRARRKAWEIANGGMCESDGPVAPALSVVTVTSDETMEAMTERMINS